MFRAREQEYQDPSRAKIEEDMRRKVKYQAQMHHATRETDQEPIRTCYKELSVTKGSHWGLVATHFCPYYTFSALIRFKF